MSRWGSILVGGSFAVFCIATAAFIGGELARERGARRALGRIGEGAHVETIVDGSRFVRMCADGRCQLLAGEVDAQGYPILASYRQSDRVCVGAGPVVEVRADASPCSGASGPSPWYVIVPLFVLLMALWQRSAALHYRRERFEHARPAVALDDGSIVFADGERGTSTRPLAAGPVTALHRVEDRHTLGDGPFRDVDRAVYEVVDGARGDHLLAIENARGRNRAIALVTFAIAAGTGLYALVSGL